MGFIKQLFNNEATVIGLCGLKKREAQNKIYETRNFVLNQLFIEAPENNILLKGGL